MHISLNEVPTLNQIVMSEVTQKFMYILKRFNFISIGQILFLQL